MDVSSDGILIDHTAPLPTFDRFDRQNDLSENDAIYQSDSILEAEWISVDDEGFIRETSLMVGTVPGN